MECSFIRRPPSSVARAEIKPSNERRATNHGPAEPAVPSYASGRDPPEGIILALCLQHSLARKGLAVFNRSAHSAGPRTREAHHGKREEGRGKKEEGRGIWCREYIFSAQIGPNIASSWLNLLSSCFFLLPNWLTLASSWFKEATW